MNGYYENTATIILSRISRPFISLLLIIADWNLDVTKDYQWLPVTHKFFYLLRSPKNELKTKKDDSA